MESNAFKCWVVLHQLPASAVGRGWCAIPSLAQAGADVGKVTLKVSDAVAHSSVLKLPTEQIKEELMEVIYIKEEPFGAGAHSSVLKLSTEQIKEELMEVIDIKEETTL
ncbi:uncharacterized protein LOC108675317 [Hyalella azteca]|uniref:Uncharacterized protein LOC108675317 n=1 Tax=Hyalella azteca TaxID=294128 RepID=A0A8B7NYB6_HYAAZ|nr:uncharacterized protein LOC108675317 [Hyalella azteca]